MYNLWHHLYPLILYPLIRSCIWISEVNWADILKTVDDHLDQCYEIWVNRSENTILIQTLVGIGVLSIILLLLLNMLNRIFKLNENG